MNHTKRSENFGRRIAELSGLLSDPNAQLTPEVRFEISRILLTNTTDSPCIVKAREDEPVFVLRGQDETADRFVKAWADAMLTYAANVTEIQPARYAQIVEKGMDATACAGEMRAYPNRRRPD